MSCNKIFDIAEGRILEVFHQGYSHPRIVNALRHNRINISQPTVSNVKGKISSQRNSGSKIKIRQKQSRLLLSIVRKGIQK